MPKGHNKDGSPKKRPVNAGRKKDPANPPKQTRTFRLSFDAIKAVESQAEGQRGAWVNEAIMDKWERELKTEKES